MWSSAWVGPVAAPSPCWRDVRIAPRRHPGHAHVVVLGIAEAGNSATSCRACLARATCRGRSGHARRARASDSARARRDRQAAAGQAGGARRVDQTTTSSSIAMRCARLCEGVDALAMPSCHRWTQTANEERRSEPGQAPDPRCADRQRQARRPFSTVSLCVWTSTAKAERSAAGRAALKAVGTHEAAAAPGAMPVADCRRRKRGPSAMAGDESRGRAPVCRSGLFLRVWVLVAPRSTPIRPSSAHGS